MNKIVSIIIPVYNCQKYIRKCIESCLNQTYDNIEIIVVDDGSSDGTGVILRELAEKHQSLRIIEQANAGVSTARNNGILSAKGYYLTFLDADDFLESKSIEELVNARKNEDLVIGSYRQLKIFGLKKAMIEENRIIDLADQTNDIYSTISKMATAPWGKLYLSSIIKDYGIHFPVDVKYGEDEIFNIEYISHCKKIRFVSEIIYNYNLQNSNAATRKYHSDIDKYFNRIIESFERAYKINDKIDEYFEIKGIIYSDFFEKIMRHYVFSRNPSVSKLHPIYLTYKPYLVNRNYHSKEIVDGDSLIQVWKNQNKMLYVRESMKLLIFKIFELFH